MMQSRQAMRISNTAMAIAGIFVAGLLVPETAAVAQSGSATVQSGAFNVLDQIEYDPRSRRIGLVGHYDPAYAGPSIPYLQYLATLLDNPTPRFSLDPVPGSREAGKAIMARIRTESEWKKIVAEWGDWFDDNGRLRDTGRIFLKVFNLKAPPNLTADNDPWGKADRYHVLSRVFARSGNDVAAATIDVFGEIRRSSTGISADQVRALMTASGAAAEFDRSIGAIKSGVNSERDGVARAYRQFFIKLDEAVGLAGSPSASAFDQAWSGQASVAGAIDAALKEFDKQFQPIFQSALVKMWDSSKEIHLPLSVLSPSLRGQVRSELIYYDLERTSLLAKLMFESDYFLKSLSHMPELADTIPAYRTEFMFEQGKSNVDDSAARYWISVDSVDASRSANGNILAIADAKMRINIRDLDTKTFNDIIGQEPNDYEKLLTSLYDDFAKQFPQYFHLLREAGKLSYAAQWLKTKDPRLVLPKNGRDTWNPPKDIAGFVVLSLSPIASKPGAERSSTSIEGGVSLQAPKPSGNLPSDKSVVSSGSRAGCKSASGGGGTAFFGTPGSANAVLIDCDEFSRPITFLRDVNAKPPPAQARRGPPAPPRRGPPPAASSAPAPNPESNPPPADRDVAALPPPPPPSPTVPPQQRQLSGSDCKSRAGTAFFGQPANPTGVDLGCDDTAPKVDLSKPVPLLREPEPKKEPPKATAPSPPAVCKALEADIARISNASRMAALAQHAYLYFADPPASPPKGFEVLSATPADLQKLLPDLTAEKLKALTAPDDLDYRAVIYRDTTTNRLAVAFRGTSTEGDWLKGNIPQGIGMRTEYYARAIELAKLVKKAADAQRVGVDFVGDSLGGGMASGAGVAVCSGNIGPNCRVTAFNPAGLHPATVPSKDYGDAPRYIDSYIVDGEPLNGLQDRRVASLIATAIDGGLLSPIASPVPSMLAIQTLMTGGFSQSIGNRTVLPADWPGSPPPGAIERHRMRSSRLALLMKLRDLQREHKIQCTPLRPGEVPPPLYPERNPGDGGGDAGLTKAELLDAGLSVVPVVNVGKDFVEATTGYNYILKRELTPLERGLATTGVALGMLGGLNEGLHILRSAEKAGESAETLAKAAQLLTKEERAAAGQLAKVEPLIDQWKTLGESRFDEVLKSKSGKEMLGETIDYLKSQRMKANERMLELERFTKAISQRDTTWWARKADVSNAEGLLIGEQKPYGVLVDRFGQMWKTHDIIASGKFANQGGNLVYEADYKLWNKIKNPASAEYLRYPAVYRGKEPPAMPAGVYGKPYQRLRDIIGSPSGGPSKMPHNENDTWIWPSASDVRWPKTPGFDTKIDPSKVVRWD